MRSNAVFIAYRLEIGTNLFLRWEESASWMRIEGERVEDAGNVTGTTRVSVDVPCPAEMGFLLVDCEVCMIQLTFQLDCLT